MLESDRGDEVKVNEVSEKRRTNNFTIQRRIIRKYMRMS